MTKMGYLLSPQAVQEKRYPIEKLIGADRLRNSQIMAMLITSYLWENPDRTLRDVEVEFRKHRLYTRLIAEPAELGNMPNMVCKDMRTGEMRPYALFITTRDVQEASQELLARVPNVGVNMERLERTGMRVLLL